MMKFGFLEPGAIRLVGLPDYYARWTIRKQLLDRAAWRHFVEVYRTAADVADQGWRGEYWGKMMRGACLMQAYSGDDDLYEVLEEAVRGLLDAQDADGRFSTYDKATEFSGWDMWCRKYVLTGMQHFYDICRDEALKARIVTALCRHADYILDHVGDGPGKVPVTETSTAWLGVNAASILEPFVRLYVMTGEARYLGFARHILSTGGCTGGDLVELALADRLKPFQYPETKAYETMSFFEGVLACYEVTGEERLFTAVRNFVEAVFESDITIIGCAGCTHELFDNSAAKQTEYSETIMQETCVTVTWMRLLARMLAATGDARYAERIEQSALNALYGSVNFRGLDQVNLQTGKLEKGLPFDSYSPLYNNRRGRGIGGFKRFADGTYYGCCACIAAAGMALYPRLAAMRAASGFVFNEFYSGEIASVTPAGRRVTFAMEGRYPKEGTFKISLSLDEPEQFSVVLRVPSFARDAVVTVCGEAGRVEPGYHVVTREWRDGDAVALEFGFDLEEVRLNGKAAFRLGPLVLARDNLKEGGAADMAEAVRFSRDGKGAAKWNALQPEGMEQARIELVREEGGALLLTDYASCGKNWTDPAAFMTVWMN